jgi:hypothetical protein
LDHQSDDNGIKKEAVAVMSEAKQKVNISLNYAVKVPKVVSTIRSPMPNNLFDRQPPAKEFTLRTSEENKYPQIPQLKAISSYCKELCNTLVSMQPDNSEKRMNAPALGKFDSLSRISDTPLVISQENSAFTLLSPPSDHGAQRAWNSIGIPRQADPRQLQQRTERRDEYFVGETSTSVIGDFIARTLFSKLTDPKQGNRIPNYMSRFQP